MPTRLLRLLPPAFLVLYGVLALASAAGNSSTFDEGLHLAAGYGYLHAGDFRINPEHPPLAKAWAALPLVPLAPAFDPTWPEWREGRPWEFAHRFLYRAGNDADRLLFRGRAAMVLLGVALAAVTWWVARRLLGPGPALVPLALCILSPDFLAHGALVTTDLPAALFFFSACAAFAAALERLTPRRALAAGVLTGVALSVKLSALLLLPTFALLVALRAADGAAWPVRWLPGWSGTEAGRPAARFRHAVALLIGTALVAGAVIWAAYGFRFAATPDPAAPPVPWRWRAYPPANPSVEAAVQTALRWRALPEAWLNGFLHLLRSSQERPAFLCGECRRTGWWWYFPATFALKTPIPVLLLILGGLVAAARGAPIPRRQALALLVPVLVYGATCLLSHIDIGHRHLLPVYPFLFVIAGAGVAAAWRTGVRAWRIATGGLLLWTALETALVCPHFLAYFNQCAGGPDGGWRYLVDSNLDWGQDLKRLKAWLDARRDDPRFREPVLCYFGSASPDYYGIPGVRLRGYTAPPDPAALLLRTAPPPGTIIAVSATCLQKVYYDIDRPELRPLLDLLDQLRAEKPIAKIGWSIFVYDYRPRR